MHMAKLKSANRFKLLEIERSEIIEHSKLKETGNAIIEKLFCGLIDFATVTRDE